MYDNKLENRVWYKAAHDIELICKPLFSQMPILNVVYQRIYPDGSKTLVSNNINLITKEFNVKNTVCGYGKSERGNNERYSFTEKHAESIKNKTLAKLLIDDINLEKTTCGLMNEFDIIETTPNYDEFFVFYGKDNTIDMSNFYINNLNLLEQFRLLFLDKARDLIEQADKDRIIKAWRPPSSNILYLNKLTKHIEILETPIVQNTNGLEYTTMMPKKFYFETSGVETYITQKEIACVLQLLRGKSANEVAKNLFISPRTVETHINSLKGKTHTNNRQQLINFFINKGFSRL